MFRSPSSLLPTHSWYQPEKTRQRSSTALILSPCSLLPPYIRPGYESKQQVEGDGGARSWVNDVVK